MKTNDFRPDGSDQSLAESHSIEEAESRHKQNDRKNRAEDLQVPWHTKCTIFLLCNLRDTHEQIVQRDRLSWNLSTDFRENPMATMMPASAIADVADVTTSPTRPPAPAGAVPVYHVPRPGTPPQKTIDYITIYGHSNLFYWWPVWLVSFILAGATYVEGRQMAAVPRGSEIAQVEIDGQVREALVAPAGQEIQSGRDPRINAMDMTVSSNNTYGVLFIATLLFVAIFSTILLRGLVSIIVVISLITLVVTFAFFGWWDTILWELGKLDVRMNAAGYLAIAIPLFLIWLAVVFLYDRQMYIVFDSGQIRYVREVGDSELVVQTEGAIVEKKRNDIFRHLLLGFGSGDIQIRTGGIGGSTIELENVLNIRRKLVIIDRMLKEKAVTVEAG